MNRLTTRRIFLAGIASSVCLAGAAITIGPRRTYRAARRQMQLWFGPGEDRLAAALTSDFAHLRFRAGATLEFVRAWRASGRGPITLPLEDQVKVQFLLSTDFVQHQGDSKREIGFAVFYDPYQAPCYNPFMLARSASTAPSAFE